MWRLRLSWGNSSPTKSPDESRACCKPGKQRGRQSRALRGAQRHRPPIELDESVVKCQSSSSDQSQLATNKRSLHLHPFQPPQPNRWPLHNRPLFQSPGQLSSLGACFQSRFLLMQAPFMAPLDGIAAVCVCSICTPISPHTTTGPGSYRSITNVTASCGTNMTVSHKPNLVGGNTLRGLCRSALFFSHLTARSLLPLTISSCRPRAWFPSTTSLLFVTCRHLATPWRGSTLHRPSSPLYKLDIETAKTNPTTNPTNNSSAMNRFLCITAALCAIIVAVEPSKILGHEYLARRRWD